MFRKIFFKEMKDSFRDRRTLLLTVFLPVIMMSALVFFYESMMSDGDENEVYSLAVEETANEELLALFEPIENIDLVRTEDPYETVREGNALAAVVFEENFLEQIESNQPTAVTVLGDSFSQNSSILMNLVTTTLSTFEKSIVSERLLAEGVDESLVIPFSISQEELSEDNQGMNLLALLIPLMIVLAIGIGAGPSASDLFAGEKEKKTMEALLMTPVSRTTMIWAKWLTISCLGAITGLVTLVVVSIEIQFFTENLKTAVVQTDNIGMILLLTAAISLVFAMLTASILTLTSVVAKTVKESQSYSTPVMMVAVFPAMMLANIGATELEFHHFAIPILNVFGLLKELIAGIINVEHILIFLGSNVLFIVIIFVIARMMFLKDKWVMN